MAENVFLFRVWHTDQVPSQSKKKRISASLSPFKTWCIWGTFYSWIWWDLWVGVNFFHKWRRTRLIFPALCGLICSTFLLNIWLKPRSKVTQKFYKRCDLPDTIVEVKKCQLKLEIWTLLIIDDCDVHSRLNSTLSVSLRNCWISSNQIGWSKD